jgi:hypothetical protein
LVPIEPLEEVVQRQARLKANAEIAENSRVVHFVLGESVPRPGEADEAHITVLAHHLIDRHGLWH